VKYNLPSLKYQWQTTLAQFIWISTYISSSTLY